MKSITKTFIAVVSFLMPLANWAQSTPTSNDHNEIRLNVLGLVLPGLVDVTYERIIDDNQAVGLQSSFYIPNEDLGNYLFKYSFSPYYRLYTSSKYSQGFFMQLGLNASSALVDVYDYSDLYMLDIRTEDVFLFGPEVGLGGKWVIRNGLVLELGASLSRNIVNADYREFNGQYWLSIGKRF